MTERTFIFQSAVNSFHYLYKDAEFFRDQAHSSSGYQRVPLSRTAVLLYILSLEGLINRVLDHFLPKHLREFVMEREDRLSFEDKWLLAPTAIRGDEERKFDRGAYPWSHFSELVQLRNDYVHPKHDRPAYYRARTVTRHEALDFRQIPKGSGIRDKDVVYRQTRIPRDPYSVLPVHADVAKKVVDDMVAQLDEFLECRLSRDNWIRTDKLTLVFPPGASLNDVPQDR
jgi:hypothetical protein